uniref:Uncharacterized protein n=1 Tax=Meloidogyne enterolobii TaxID=390850 RepID=A0A6V7Y8C0_MELEN|nr:unnamed protein product [Meloidogyne enterolobii]
MTLKSMNLTPLACRLCVDRIFSGNINLLPSKMGMIESHRQISHYTSSFKGRIRRILEFKVLGFWRKRIAENMANQFYPERVITMGPDFSCAEWLMNAGATSILLSDGTIIKSQKEMRFFLKNHGFDINNLQPTKIAEEFYSKNKRQSSINNDIKYDERWKHVSSIHIKEIDATDAVITDKGFNYLQECKSIESLKLNFNDYFGDEGLLQLSHGRIPRTLRKMEICFNPALTERSALILSKFRQLKRLHMYFLPNVSKREAMLRQLKISLPHCKITFPEPFFIGMGYESEEERAAYKRIEKQKKINDPKKKP